MDLGRYSEALTRNPNGVWSADDLAKVSYPSSGHQDCLEVEDGSFWFQHRNSCISAVVERFPPNGPIFDVGGGNGVVAANLKALGWSVVLVEPGDVGCRNAKARGLEDIVQTTFEGAAFHNRVLPAAGLFDVIEHIDDDVGFLRTIGSKLVPGGRIYATVPASPWLWSVDDEEAGHFRRYRKRDLVSALQSAGFRVSFVSHLFAPLPLGIFLLRSLPYRIKLLREVSGSRTKREHMPGGPFQWILTRILRIELRRLPVSSIPFGSSILVVAEWPDPSDPS